MLTRAQLMDLALTQAGLDSGFYTQARQWLNNFIAEQARNFDWPFYFKFQADQNFVGNQLEYSVPTDFARPGRAIYMIQGGTRSQDVQVMEPEEFGQYINIGSSTRPMVSMIRYDYTAGAYIPKLVFNSVPTATSGNLMYRLPYYRLPADMSTTNSDDTKIPDFLNQDFLIESMKKWAFEHQDDARYAAKKQETDESLHNAKMNTYNAMSQKVELANQVFKGPRRGSGDNGWWGN